MSVQDPEKLRNELSRLWLSRVRPRALTVQHPDGESFRHWRQHDYFDVLDESGTWRFGVPLEAVAATAAERPTRNQPLVIDSDDAPYFSAPGPEQVRHRVLAQICQQWVRSIAWPGEAIAIECGPSPHPAVLATLACWEDWAKTQELEPIARAAVFSRKRACFGSYFGWEGVLARVAGNLRLVRLCPAPELSAEHWIANAASRVALAEMAVIEEEVHGLLIRVPSEPGEPILTETLAPSGDGQWISRFDRALEAERGAFELCEYSDEEAERAEIEAQAAAKRRRRADRIAERDSRWNRLGPGQRTEQMRFDHQTAQEADNYREHLIDTFKDRGLTEPEWREALADALKEE